MNKESNGFNILSYLSGPASRALILGVILGLSFSGTFLYGNRLRQISSENSQLLKRLERLESVNKKGLDELAHQEWVDSLPEATLDFKETAPIPPGGKYKNNVGIGTLAPSYLIDDWGFRLTDEEAKNPQKALRQAEADLKMWEQKLKKSQEKKKPPKVD